MINLKLKKSMFVEKYYPLLFDYSNRWECYMGSAGSAKSYFITQKLIMRATREEIKILVCRKTGATLRNSCFSLFKEILTKWKISDQCKITESNMRITFPNGSEVIFMGLDEETKLLSLNNIGCVFVEEAYEVEKSIIEQLNLRMRGKSSGQQIIMAWNPINKNHWLYDFCEVNPPSSFMYTHSTYKDNPFLNPEYVQALEEMYTTNPLKAMVYCDGKWGVNPEGLVFSNWCIESFDEIEKAKTCEHRVGSDLGFRDASTIISSYFDRFNKTIYVADEFYKTGQTIEDIYNAIIKMELGKSKIVFDSADPMSIQYFKRQGINAHPCIKGKGSIEARIEFLKIHKIVIHPKCIKLIEEFENFSYKLDKKTNEYTSDTTHEWSHGIDGLGYAYSDIYAKGGRVIFKNLKLGI